MFEYISSVVSREIHEDDSCVDSYTMYVKAGKEHRMEAKNFIFASRSKAFF